MYTGAHLPVGDDLDESRDEEEDSDAEEEEEEDGAEGVMVVGRGGY